MIDWLPQEVSDLEVVFPARVSHLMPPYDEIPQQFNCRKCGGADSDE